MTDIVIPDAESATASLRRRKPVKATREMVAPLASTEPLSVDDMKLTDASGRTSHLWRLKYKGCPGTGSGGMRNPKTTYTDMNRDNLVREMYRLFSPNHGATENTYFRSVTTYIGWLDDNNLDPIEGDYFHNKLTTAYMEKFSNWVSQGRYKKGSWSVARNALGFVLKAQGRHIEYERLPKPRDHGSDIASHKALDIESELKPTAQALFRGYYGFLKHYQDGTIPEIDPMWDGDIFNAHSLSIGLTPAKQGRIRGGFKTTVKRSNADWRNQMTRIAMMISYMLTGMNASSMAKMTRSDVKFRQAKDGSYIFESTKPRAKYLKIDNGMGVNKNAKRFLESWLPVSEKISEEAQSKQVTQDVSEWLFPILRQNGSITNHFAMQGSPQNFINIKLAHLGLTSITPSILRKTKTSTLMKVMEDVFLVSLAANNSVTTIKKAYGHGTEEDNRRSWAAAGNALYEIAKGEEVTTAVAKAKFDYHDPLSEYDAKKRLRPENEALTPLGVRCENPTKGASEIIDKALKKSGIGMHEGEALCTDFLGCFDCEFHKLVAAVDDIWLMLSFREVLEEMLQYPSVNSLPKSRHSKLCVTIDSILGRFKEIAGANFKEAEELHKSANHPLYASLYSLNDLLERFS